jgi:uncharacterized membrane protein YecN with MAPEG domain
MVPTVAPLYAGLLGLLLVVLSLLVVRLRMRYRVGLGDGGQAALTRAIRVQGNFAEHVPLALLLIFAVEGLGYAAWVVHALGAALILGRLAHAQGLGRHEGESPGRFLGTVTTFSVLIVASGLCLFAALTRG